MATRRLVHLAGRLALPTLVSGGLAIGMAVPAQADPTEIPDAGSRPAPAGEVTLPDGSSITLPERTGAGFGPLADEIAQVEAEIMGLVNHLRDREPELPARQEQSESARSDWQAAEAERRIAEQALHDLVEQAYRGAAAVLPMLTGVPLRDLAAHAPVPVDAPMGGEAAARKLLRAEEAAALALERYQLALDAERTLDGEIETLQAELATLQSRLDSLRERNADLLTAQEEAEQRRAAAGAFPVHNTVAGLRAHDRAQQAVGFALRQLGKPYLWGAEGPDRYDCSGLMWDAYRSVGVTLPRVAADQYFGTRARPVARHALLPGDLVFFNHSGTDWRQVHHVGMYIGDGRMVHAPNRNDVVKVSPIWWGSFFAATRVLPAEQVSPPTTPPPTTPPPTTPPPTTPPPTAPPTTPPADDPTATVPDLSGMTPDEAREAIEDAGLVPDALEDWVIGDCEPTVLIGQRPAAGTEVAEGSVVEFWICAEVVPELQSDLAAMEAALEAVELLARVEPVESDQPAGTLLGTEPGAGETVPRGSEVIIQVSLGLIPDLTGKTCAQAREALAGTGLEPAFEIAEELGDHPTGQVVDQDPDPDTPRPVDLTVVLLYVDSPDGCPDPETAEISLLIGTLQIRNLLGQHASQQPVLV